MPVYSNNYNLALLLSSEVFSSLDMIKLPFSCDVVQFEGLGRQPVHLSRVT